MVDQFSAEELCAIIKTCGDAGVSELCLGRIRLNFNPVQYQTPQQVKRFNPEKEYSQMEEEALEQDEATLKLDRLHQLIIEDPVEAEKLLSEEVENPNA